MDDQHQPDPTVPAPPDGWTPAAGGAATPAAGGAATGGAATPQDGWAPAGEPHPGDAGTASGEGWGPPPPGTSPVAAGYTYPPGGSYAHAGAYPQGGAYPPAGQHPPAGPYPQSGAYPPAGQYPQGGGYGPPPPGWGPAAAAGYPPPGARAEQSRSSGAAVTALVLGCSALLLAFLPFVGLLGVVLGIAAVALGVVGVRKARDGAGGRGLAVGGIATGAVSVLLGIAVTAGTMWFIENGGGVFGEGWLDEEWDLGVGWEMDRYERARVDNAPLLGQDDAFVTDDVTYRVREVDLDADEEVLGVSRWASHPEGRYVLVDLDVTYDGPYTFDVGEEIYAFAFDDEARAYADTCMGPGPTAWDHDPLQPGDTVVVQLCFDVPVDQADRLSLVMDPWTLEGDPGVWDLSR